MIHLVFSSLPTFKNLAFKPGLNILLAEKSPGATDRQTRNRAGKTSLIELIHFVMGGNVDANSVFKADELKNFSFGMQWDLGDGVVSAERTGEKPNKVTVAALSGDKTLRSLLAHGSVDGADMTNQKWKQLLGSLVFGLTMDQDDDGPGKCEPTFRSLFSYFVRRHASGAFGDPIKHSTQQQPSDYQVAVTFLLGLDWTIPKQWQVVREREKALRTLRSEAAKGTFGPIIGTTRDLRTQLTVAEERTRKMRENLSTFRVLPEYRSLEAEASKLTQSLGELANENTIDRQLIDELEESFQSETPPKVTDLERLYEEAGVVLPHLIGRRFQDVRLFHESVVHNRKLYLGGELEAAKRRILRREEEKTRLGKRYSQVMGILKSHGALDQYSKLQAELTKEESLTEAIRVRFAAAEQLEGRTTELDIERDGLLLRLRQDYRDQEDALKHAIVVFEEMSSGLYEEAGSLMIDASRNGPHFDVKIHGEKSKGISNMQIFCFDMMLMQLSAERGIGPGFLVHDSHLFDGVDERQVGKALQLGAKAASRLGFQYIVTLNSDAVPRDLPEGFSLDESILPVRLTDATEDGGLFGIRFG